MQTIPTSVQYHASKAQRSTTLADELRLAEATGRHARPDSGRPFALPFFRN